jgi:DNA-binding transcriptional MerR regulator
MASARPHGRFLAGEAGDLAGVSGTTIGQWARRGLIRASQSGGDPHVYSVEDVAEAAVVHVLLERGLRHGAIREAIAALGDYGDWPLSSAPLATTSEDDGARVVLRAGDGMFVLRGHDWQRLAVEPPLRDVLAPAKLRLVTGGAARASDGR